MTKTLIERKDYRSVKQMNREQMTAYLAKIYRRGYEKGLEDAKKRPEVSAPPSPVSKGGE